MRLNYSSRLSFPTDHVKKKEAAKQRGKVQQKENRDKPRCYCDNTVVHKFAEFKSILNSRDRDRLNPRHRSFPGTRQSLSRNTIHDLASLAPRDAARCRVTRTPSDRFVSKRIIVHVESRKERGGDARRNECGRI